MKGLIFLSILEELKQHLFWTQQLCADLEEEKKKKVSKWLFSGFFFLIWEGELTFRVNNEKVRQAFLWES